MGRIPVYMYDDVPWLPYEGSNISIAEFGLVGKMGALGATAKRIHGMSEADVLTNMQKIKAAREHYLYAGVIAQIEKFIADPLGPNGGQLRCTHVPDKDHRRSRRTKRKV